MKTALAGSESNGSTSTASHMTGTRNHMRNNRGIARGRSESAGRGPGDAPVVTI